MISLSRTIFTPSLRTDTLAYMSALRTRSRPGPHDRTPEQNQRSNTALLLGIILAVGFVMRLGFAFSAGNEYDIGVNQGWAHSAAELGIVRSYQAQVDGTMLPNYPPLSIMVFAVTGHAYRLLVSHTYDVHLPAYRLAIKLPAIIADIASCVLLFFLFRRLRGRHWGLAAALIYALHPVVIYDSAVWGQTDSLYTLALLITFLGAAHNRWWICGLSLAAAFLLKAQTIALVPLIGILAMANDRRFMQFLLGGSLMMCAILLPFAVENRLMNIVDVYHSSIGTFPNLSKGAANLWLSLYGSKADMADTGFFFRVISYRGIGFLLFGIATVFCLVVLPRSLWKSVAWSRSRAMSLFLAGSVESYAFFFFNTEMHERYLFPFLALGLPLVLTGPSGIVLYLLISVLFLGNLLWILPFSTADRALFTEFPGLPQGIATLHLCAFILLCAHVWRTIQRSIPQEERPSCARLCASFAAMYRARRPSAQ